MGIKIKFFLRTKKFKHWFSESFLVIYSTVLITNLIWQETIPEDLRFASMFLPLIVIATSVYFWINSHRDRGNILNSPSLGLELFYILISILSGIFFFLLSPIVMWAGLLLYRLSNGAAIFYFWSKDNFSEETSKKNSFITSSDGETYVEDFPISKELSKELKKDFR